MNTKQIYEKYFIPPNLQEHMLYVASLSKIIVDNWTGPTINKNAIIQASLFHDIAKPLHFDLEKQAQYGMSQTDIQKLKNHQQTLKDAFGDDEHICTVKIFENMGCSVTARTIINNFEWINIPQLEKIKDLNSLIPIYADMRIGPMGIVTLQNRLHDLKQRTGESDHEHNGIELEQLISKHVLINLQSVSNQHLKTYVNILLNMDIV